MYFVYIIFSPKLNKYYIGYTNNIEQRLMQHKAKHKGFTANASDWILKYFETVETKELAMKREREIKNWKSRIKVERLIQAKA